MIMAGCHHGPASVICRRTARSLFHPDVAGDVVLICLTVVHLPEIRLWIAINANTYEVPRYLRLSRMIHLVPKKCP